MTALLDLLKRYWNWLDGKKTVFAGVGFMLFGGIGWVLNLLEQEKAIQHVLTGAALLGLGGKAQKIIDALKRKE